MTRANELYVKFHKAGTPPRGENRTDEWVGSIDNPSPFSRYGIGYVKRKSVLPENDKQVVIVLERANQLRNGSTKWAMKTYQKLNIARQTKRKVKRRRVDVDEWGDSQVRAKPKKARKTKKSRKQKK